MLIAVQTQIKPVFNQVDSAVNIHTAIAQPINQPSVAYVVPLTERPAQNSRDMDVGQPLQEVNVGFGVVIGLQSINDPTGSKGMEALQQLRKELRKKLFGWSPAPDFNPITLGNGDLVGFAKNGLWWIDRFTTQTWYQGNQ
ncbi:hypothetical protein [Neptunicella sp. SCSIO 80796]|uniref:phage tail terminator protein n=1 Tax=Neptunicella plasticusilytica TaxID=3117012 RepID=UPI003A4D2E29